MSWKGRKPLASATAGLRYERVPLSLKNVINHGPALCNFNKCFRFGNTPYKLLFAYLRRHRPVRYRASIKTLLKVAILYTGIMFIIIITVIIVIVIVVITTSTRGFGKRWQVRGDKNVKIISCRMLLRAGRNAISIGLQRCWRVVIISRGDMLNLKSFTR